MELPTSFDFSPENLKPVEIPVKGPNGKTYLLKEATAEVAKNYRAVVMESAKMNDGRMSFSADGTVKAEPILVAGCLYEQYTQSNGQPGERPAILGEILRWPNRVVQPLFKAARQISGLDEDEKGTEADSGKAGTTVTS